MARWAKAHKSAVIVLASAVLASGMLLGGAGAAGATAVSTTTPSPDEAILPPSAVTPAGTTAPPTDPATEPPADGDAERPTLDDFRLKLEGVSVGSFRSGDIITDRNMYSGTTMSATEVQAFLTAQAPPCTIAACLATATFASTNQAKTAECTAYSGRTESAAGIIARVGQACGVSQKALLTLIQKESQLVTNPAPTQRQFDSATGYFCLDDGKPCDARYQGFFNQVYNAALQLKAYGITPKYAIGSPVTFQYAPDPDCGEGQVTFANKATAALFAYTPYLPNDDALDPEKPEDDCTSYGNLNFWVVYTDWFGYPQIDVDRVSGTDRYAGAVAIAKAAFPAPATAPVVVIANGQNYPDALSAGPAAVAWGGPLLLTDPNALPQAVADEITSLTPGRIVVVGGVNSVSETVKAQLATLVAGVKVDRIAGDSRYATSRAIVEAAFPDGASGAYLATGANFPDALSAGAAAGSRSQPVLLVDGGLSTLDAASSALLERLEVSRIRIVGGVNSVPSSIKAAAEEIADTTRISGSDRYATSQAVNTDAFATATRAFFATGQNFPDALAGSAWAGRVDAPLYVVPSTCVPQAVRVALRPTGISAVTLLGGPNSLGAGVQNLTSCDG